MAAGTLVGLLVAGVYKSRRRGLLLLTTAAILGVATACMGLLSGFWPMALLLFAMGCFSGFINVQIQAWLQQRVDRSVLGRVSSVAMLSSFGLMPSRWRPPGSPRSGASRGCLRSAAQRLPSSQGSAHCSGRCAASSSGS